MNDRTEDLLTTVHASLAAAAQTVFHIALKGRASAGLREQLIGTLRSALQAAENLGDE